MASKARSLLRSLLRFWESQKIPKMGGVVHPFTDEETKMKKLFQRKKIVCSGSQTRSDPSSRGFFCSIPWTA